MIFSRGQEMARSATSGAAATTCSMLSSSKSSSRSLQHRAQPIWQGPIAGIVQLQDPRDLGEDERRVLNRLE